MKHAAVIGMAAVAVALAGCESMGTAAQSKTTQGAVLGGLLGAGTGAIVGNQSDHAGDRPDEVLPGGRRALRRGHQVLPDPRRRAALQRVSSTGTLIRADRDA